MFCDKLEDLWKEGGSSGDGLVLGGVDKIRKLVVVGMDGTC